jgi:hypothetical protein
MRIVMGIGCWNVLADWLGAERVVFTSKDIFACIKFVAENS